MIEFIFKEIGVTVIYFILFMFVVVNSKANKSKNLHLFIGIVGLLLMKFSGYLSIIKFTHFLAFQGLGTLLFFDSIYYFAGKKSLISLSLQRRFLPLIYFIVGAMLLGIFLEIVGGYLLQLWVYPKFTSVVDWVILLVTVYGFGVPAVYIYFLFIRNLLKDLCKRYNGLLFETVALIIVSLSVILGNEIFNLNVLSWQYQNLPFGNLWNIPVAVVGGWFLMVGFIVLFYKALQFLVLKKEYLS